MSDEETKKYRRARVINWTKWAAIWTVIGAMVATVAFAAPMISRSVKIYSAPDRIENHEQRIVSLEQSSLTNGIMFNNRFDRQDEKLQKIISILSQRWTNSIGN